MTEFKKFALNFHFLIFHCLLLFCMHGIGGTMICTQDEFGQTEVIYCPDDFSSNETDTDGDDQSGLNYCCNDNGRIRCCTYEDYYERHFGPSTSTIIALLISNTVVLAAAVYWCKKNIRRPKPRPYPLDSFI